MAGMYARRGEVQAARAAQDAGVPFCLSTVSVCSIEEVAGAVARPPWFQLYMIKDRGRLSDLLARAQAVAAPPLVFTVDMPVPGLRYRDARSGFSSAPSLSRSLQRLIDGATHPAWVWDLFVHGRPHSFGNLKGVETRGPGQERGLGAYWSWIRENFDSSATWKDLDWIRRQWRGPIILKGVLDPQDAELAAQAGADGVIVSNHGGRQLDGVSSSIAALPAVVDKIGGRMPVLMDGGIRSGLDVLKALALGADACLIGRAWAWALAAEGERGVARMLATLRQELTVALALTGCGDVAKAGRDLIQS
jgi:L-lactate dehydrogenase (cytochrome)